MTRSVGRHWQCLGVLVLFVILIGPVAAQMEVVVEPASVTISETQPYMVLFGIPLTLHPAPENATEQGPSESSVTRTLTVWVARNITNVNVDSSDLVREDGAYVILASKVNATVPEADLQEKGKANVPVSFELGGVHSGKFAGNLMVSYLTEEQASGTVKVPVTVNMKDGPVGPVLVLLIGVLLGAGLSRYRAKGKKADEIRNQHDNLAEIMKGDDPYLNLDPRLFFRSGIDRDMKKVRDRLALNDVDGAETAVKSAWATWDHWGEYKDRLPLQIQRLTDLRKELDKMEKDLKEKEVQVGKFRYLQEERKVLSGLYTQLQNPVEFKEFQDAFTKFEAGLDARENSFDTFERVVQTLMLHEPKDEDRGTPKGQKVAEFWGTLTGLTQEQDIASLEKAIRNEFPTMGFKAKFPRHHEIEKKKPDWWTRVGKFWFSMAAIRLGLFGILVFGLLVVVLVITGYKELYLANPTFGAGAGDYFAIFLWGLGTSPGSEAAVKAVSDKFG